MKNILKQENIALQLTFNPGLTLTGFRTTRPWVAYEQTSGEGRSKKVVGALRKPVRGLTLDLPQVDLMNFRVEYVRPRSGRCLGREAAERATIARGRPSSSGY